jgi:phosphatidate phosphatase LPIN
VNFTRETVHHCKAKVLDFFFVHCVHSPHDSRPSSPVQSDTEFEMNRQSKAVGAEEEEETRKSALHGQSWRWGELPSPLPRPLLTSHSSQMSVNAVELTDPEPVLSSDREGHKRQQEGEHL